MKTSDFDYHLPPERIAQHPAKNREDARLLVLNRADQSLLHAHISDLPDLLRPKDLLVLNDTKVIPARIFGQKETGGRVELLLLEETGLNRWSALLKASRRPAVDETFQVGAKGEAVARVLSHGERGHVELEFTCTRPLLDLLEAEGEPPLPPYIQRKNTAPWQRQSDLTRYQTVYARHHGAVAAPTAGLHFTPELFEQLARHGIEKTTLTLHVGLGTFRPVNAEHLHEHTMHSERYDIPGATAATINKTRASGGRIVAVGSTSVRTLESVADEQGHIPAGQGRTEIFIHEPYRFKAVDAMLTNFHLPKSTLLMMVCALAGHDVILEAYRTAIEEKYRFFSYGDAMLIL